MYCTALLHSVHTMNIKVTRESSDQFYIDSIVYCRMLASFVPVISTNNVCSYIYTVESILFDDRVFSIIILLASANI